MTNPRHPDIEIYIKNCSLETIQAWLASHAEKIDTLSSKGNSHSLTLHIDDHAIDTLIHERAVGKAWTSLWLKSDKSPWATDLECAHEAASALGAQVRCIVSGWEDGDDPDEYWKVENGIDEKIQWQT
jgi:hypothetical protein